MRLTHLVAASALLCAPFILPLNAQQLPSPISTDPAPDKTNPAAMETFQLPSHGAKLNALAYVAAGAGPYPVVILLLGFPGNEKNLDLAQAIRRDGGDVVYFDYRGSWGSPGDFSFTHSIEDTQSAIAYVRDLPMRFIKPVRPTSPPSTSRPITPTPTSALLEKAVLEALEYVQHK
jgi:hypothetical protein